MTLSELQKTLGTRLSSYETGEIFRYLCGFSRSDLILHARDEADAALCEKALAVMEQRGKNIPLAYLLGRVSFFGDDYIVRPGCLIPRADTEVLVEEAISRTPENGVLWDLCTGTGCVPIAVLRNRPDVRAWGVEKFPVPLRTAEENAEALGVKDRFSVSAGDVLNGDIPASAPMPDTITANPPYIASKVCETLDEQVKKEPLSALDGGEDGLCFYRAIVEKYHRCLAPDGCFLFEIGYDQGESVSDLCRSAGFDVSLRRDYENRDRVILAQKTKKF